MPLQQLGFGSPFTGTQQRPSAGENLANVLMGVAGAYEKKLDIDRVYDAREEKELSEAEGLAYSDMLNTFNAERESGRYNELGNPAKEAWEQTEMERMQGLFGTFKSKSMKMSEPKVISGYMSTIEKYNIANTKDVNTKTYSSRMSALALDKDKSMDKLKEIHNGFNELGLRTSQKVAMSNHVNAHADQMVGAINNGRFGNTREEMKSNLSLFYSQDTEKDIESGSLIADDVARAKVERAMTARLKALRDKMELKDQTITSANSEMAIGGSGGSASMEKTLKASEDQAIEYKNKYGKVTTGILNAVSDMRVKVQKQKDIEGLVDSIVAHNTGSKDGYIRAIGEGLALSSEGRYVVGMDGKKIPFTSAVTKEQIDAEIETRISQSELYLIENKYDDSANAVLNGLIKLERSNPKFKSSLIDKMKTETSTGLITGSADEIMKTLKMTQDYNTGQGNLGDSWVNGTNMGIINAQYDRMKAYFESEDSEGGTEVTSKEQLHMTERLRNTVYGISNRAKSTKKKSELSKAFISKFNEEAKEYGKEGAADEFISGFVAGSTEFADGSLYLLAQRFGNKTLGFGSNQAVDLAREQTIVLDTSTFFAKPFLSQRIALIKPNSFVTDSTLVESIEETIKAEMGDKYADLDKSNKLTIEQYPNSKDDTITHVVIRGSEDRIVYSRQFLPNELAYGKRVQYTKGLK